MNTKQISKQMWKAVMDDMALTPWAKGASETPGPDMPDLPRRTQTTPVLGYRSWRLGRTDDGWRIKSPTQLTQWQGPILRADHPPDDRSPWSRAGNRMFGSGPGNHGLYAWTLTRGPMVSAGIYQRVEGIVELLGKVVVHEKGYRAEMVRIRRLWAFGLEAEDVPDALDDLSRTYACDVGVGEEPSSSAMRVADDVDPEECPVCSQSHPESPLACETSEGGELVVLGTEEEAESWSPGTSLRQTVPRHGTAGTLRQSYTMHTHYDPMTGTVTYRLGDD